MRRIVFIIHTEFHLIETISYILNNFSNPSFEVYVYRIATTNSKRLDNYAINGDEIPGIYRVIRYDTTYRYSRQFKESLDEIIRIGPERMILFDEGYYWFPYLMRKLKAQGCKICLAPDGANVYSFDKLSFNYIIKYIFHFVCFTYSHLLLPPIIPIIRRHHYGYSRYIDELWMQHPESFYNYYNRKVVEQPVYNTEESRIIINKVFGFKIPPCLLVSKPIVFFDAPLSNDIIDICYNFLTVLQKRFPNRHLLIKMHPHSHNYALSLYRKLKNVEFIPNDFPAELYIQSLNNAVLISAYSNCLFSYNPSCLYFWIYPMFKNLLANEVLVNPTKHIQEVDSVDDVINQIALLN